MRISDWSSDVCSSDLEARIGSEEHVDVRDDVEGDLLGELPVLLRIADEDRAGLLEQFVHAFLARARHRLIGRYDDALDAGRVVQRLQRDDHLGGRAVRVGDDALRSEEHTSELQSLMRISYAVFCLKK